MLRCLKYAVAATAMLCILAAGAFGAVDATGKWAWNIKGQDGNEFVVTLDLKQDGERLSGTLTRMDSKLEISDGKISKANDLSFVVNREINGQQIKAVFTGKLDGDTIKGTIAVNIQGEDRTMEWTANRAK